MAEGCGDEGVPAAFVDVALGDGVVVEHVALVEEFGCMINAGGFVDLSISYGFFGRYEEIPFAEDVDIGAYGPPFQSLDCAM